MLDKLTVKDADVAGKRVLVRVDFNVPIGPNGAVTDDTRIRAALPTIRYLVDHDAKVILVSHLGRPKGQPEDRFRLDPVVRVLAGLLGRDVRKVDAVVGPEVTAAVAGMTPGDVLMLENVRFEPGEKTNDPALARQLADLADLYVNDAFGTAHRAHASTEGVAHLLPAYAGLLLGREVETLTGMLQDPQRPFVAVLGGSKVSDKFAVIDRFLDIVDALLIGGGMCFTFLVAKGIEVGDSLVEEEWVEPAAAMLKKAEERGVDLVLPVDFVVATEVSADAETEIVGREENPARQEGTRYRPDHERALQTAPCRSAHHLLERADGRLRAGSFEEGTRAVASAIARNSRAVSVVGGGDSDAALRKFGLEERMTFVSTGGGASMKLLEGEPLPGVVALLDRT